jgi:hypothetical protein
MYHSLPKQLLYLCKVRNDTLNGKRNEKRAQNLAKAKANTKLKTKLKIALLYCDNTIDPELSDACELLWSEIDDLSDQLLKNL